MVTNGRASNIFQGTYFSVDSNLFFFFYIVINCILVDKVHLTY